MVTPLVPIKPKPEKPCVNLMLVLGEPDIWARRRQAQPRERPRDRRERTDRAGLVFHRRSA